MATDTDVYVWKSPESRWNASTPSMEPERHQSDRILEVLRAGKALAQEYRRLTGKPFGITGQVAEYA